MCLILDTNKYGDFLNPENEDMRPVREWIERKGGKIAYSPTDKFESELDGKIKSQFNVYRVAGKIKLFNEEEVENVQRDLQDLESNDPHIIALAIVANVSLLVSGDRDLHRDFKRIIRGNIYQTRSHRRQLHKDLCP